MFYLSLLVLDLWMTLQCGNFSPTTNFVKDPADTSNLQPPEKRETEEETGENIMCHCITRFFNKI